MPIEWRDRRKKWQGRAYTAHMNEKINIVRSEMTIESAMFLDQQVAHEKVIQKMNGEHRQQEKALTISKQEEQAETNKHGMAEVTIKQMNENAAKQIVNHGKALEEMAAQSEEKLKKTISKAKENAKIAADDAREERMSQKQTQDIKLEAERQKTADAVQAAIKAEEKLEDEIKMKTMKGDELQKWSRDDINSLKLEATKKQSEYEAFEIKHNKLLPEVRGNSLLQKWKRAEPRTNYRVRSLKDRLALNIPAINTRSCTRRWSPPKGTTCINVKDITWRRRH